MEGWLSVGLDEDMLCVGVGRDGGGLREGQRRFRSGRSLSFESNDVLNLDTGDKKVGCIFSERRESTEQERFGRRKRDRTRGRDANSWLMGRSLSSPFSSNILEIYLVSELCSALIPVSQKRRERTSGERRDRGGSRRIQARAFLSSLFSSVFSYTKIAKKTEIFTPEIHKIGTFNNSNFV